MGALDAHGLSCASSAAEPPNFAAVKTIVKPFKTLLETMDDTTEKGRITWVRIVNAIIQAAIAALTALGVGSCMRLF